MKKEPARPSAERGSPEELLRADARRNRCRILEAAEAVFASKNVGASTEEVAAAAGVGIGTVFRHFPTKNALLEALLIAKLRRLVEEAEELSSSEDPRAALFTFFTHMLEQSSSKKAFSEALAAAGVDVRGATLETKRDLGNAVNKLLCNAQRAGTVRKDVQVPELMALMAGASHAAEHATNSHEVATRALAIIFDGLRPAGAARPRVRRFTGSAVKRS
ncbi:MAG TPA: helix-turn-helix domain-containing protein [Polyangiaceae bacterium]|nr:helix-turn-helix domain-containing protein [Polyangiaceae bacterium]